ncbi:unnamed protein product, partial [Hydatigera taeniaeformis]|uniref:Glutamine amidotransferase type-2 domain-containing protein n=1 Tax=Hydatigena taeniaeformis TaxID=6205 RepID=A0A0R3X2Y3_HYDTA
LNSRSHDAIPINFSLGDVGYKAFGAVTPTQNHGPHFRSSDFILLWDGRIYSHLSSVLDAQWLLEEISACDGSNNVIISLFGLLRGPFAFILIKKSAKRIFFGRDKYGRRSLVCNSAISHLGSLSLSDDDTFAEVPASGIYVASAVSGGGFHIDSWYPWSSDHLQFWISHPLNTSVKHEAISNDYKLRTPQGVDGRDPVNVLMNLLREAIAVQVHLPTPVCQMCFKSGSNLCLHARIGVLFSGGLDSTVIAALVDRKCLIVTQTRPPQTLRFCSGYCPIYVVEPPQLLIVFTVSAKFVPSCCLHLQTSYLLKILHFRGCDETDFQRLYSSPESAPDRQTALSSFEELQHLNPSRHWHLVLVKLHFKIIGGLFLIRNFHTKAQADVSVEEVKTIR